MKDRIITGISKDKSIRFFAVDATETVKKGIEIHQLFQPDSIILGRLLIAAIMMGIDLKSDKDRITLKIESDGPIGGALVTSDKNGNVKGYVNKPGAAASKGIIGIKDAIGNGVLTIIKDLGLKHPYIGTVKLIYGTIARDLTYYFVKSEQIPTSISLGVLIDEHGNIRQAGGFMVQLLPETKEEIISKVEKNIRSFPNLTDMMDMGYSIEKVINDFILKDLSPEIKRTVPVRYYCDCSKEKFARGLKLLGKEELEEALEKGEKLEIVCHFCRKKYIYGENDILEILNEL